MTKQHRITEELLLAECSSEEVKFFTVHGLIGMPVTHINSIVGDDPGNCIRYTINEMQYFGVYIYNECGVATERINYKFNSVEEYDYDTFGNVTQIRRFSDAGNRVSPSIKNIEYLDNGLHAIVSKITNLSCTSEVTRIHEFEYEKRVPNVFLCVLEKETNNSGTTITTRRQFNSNGDVSLYNIDGVGGGSVVAYAYNDKGLVISRWQDTSCGITEYNDQGLWTKKYHSEMGASSRTYNDSGQVTHHRSYADKYQTHNWYNSKGQLTDSLRTHIVHAGSIRTTSNDILNQRHWCEKTGVLVSERVVYCPSTIERPDDEVSTGDYKSRQDLTFSSSKFETWYNANGTISETVDTEGKKLSYEYNYVGKQLVSIHENGIEILSIPVFS